MSRSVTLAEVGAVYHRRPSIYQVDPEFSEPDTTWAVKEARFGFGGLLSCLPGWFNHPADIARCEYKPMEYAADRRAGLRVPSTLLTNNGTEARAFGTNSNNTITPDAGQGQAPDALLTVRVNGADLTADHGFPSQVVVPALPGVHNIK